MSNFVKHILKKYLKYVHKNGKKAFGLKFNNTDSSLSSIGFMVPLDDYKGKSGQRYSFKNIKGNRTLIAVQIVVQTGVAIDE